MSRSKIVKEAGVKPTDFENTVAKVRFVRFEERIVRENFARDVYLRGNLHLLFHSRKQMAGLFFGEHLSENGALKSFSHARDEGTRVDERVQFE